MSFFPVNILKEVGETCRNRLGETTTRISASTKWWSQASTFPFLIVCVCVCVCVWGGGGGGGGEGGGASISVFWKKYRLQSISERV